MGKVNFFPFFASRGLWHSTALVLVLVDVGESDLRCRHEQQIQYRCPCVWELGHRVCVEEARAAAELLQLFCKAQEARGASLSA